MGGGRYVGGGGGVSSPPPQPPPADTRTHTTREHALPLPCHTHARARPTLHPLGVPQALQILVKEYGLHDARVAFALHNLGGFYLLEKKLDQAAETYQEVGFAVKGLD